MDHRLLGAALPVLLVVAGACAHDVDSPPDRGDWVGTIAADGNVTTVVNESGSLWAGNARLIEEASIGVESGADAYMFGRLHTVTAGDQRIIILDGQAFAVRSYDFSGEFLGNLGGIGQGPGEFNRPRVVSIDEAGRVYVLDIEGLRVNVYARDGTPAETWSVPTPACCAWPMYPRGEGTLWMPVEEVDRDTRERRYGVQAYGVEGPFADVLWVPDIGFEAITYTFDGRELNVPFGPRLAWGPTPSGGVFVADTSRYRFEVHQRDGSTLIIEKTWEPQPYPAAEVEWQRRRTVAGLQRQISGWTWDGAEIPSHKPALTSIVPVASGGYWVGREGQSRRVPDCTEDPIAALSRGETTVFPCWEPESIIDAFDASGRYLGEVEVPEVMAAVPLLLHVDGELVVTGAQNDEGVYEVKRYRLVIPN